ncbi:MAG TPA: DUF922 domain-containing protein [Mesorhizobium sp.]
MKFEQWPYVLALAASVCVAQARAQGQPVEQEQSYAITGASGPELYASIGEHGPLVGGGVRAIAHTNFKLTWTRNYVPQGSACVLVSARPKLVITYTLPQPANLSAALQRRWNVFIDGIRRHERVHGDHIKAMVKRIEATTIGVRVENDPSCRKIREQLKGPLSQASLAQRQQSRDFDRVEMGEGGTIRLLILALVNGG